MTKRFVVEFRSRVETSEQLLPSLNAITAETLPLAQREVERTLASGAADEAVIYAPAKVLRAGRVITATDIAN